MLKVALRGLRARGLRLLLSALAVVFGTAFVAGAFVLTDTLQRVFDDLFATAASGTDVVVRPPAAAVDEGGDPTGRGDTLPLSLVSTVGAVEGVDSASPSVFFPVGLLQPDGEPYQSTGAPVFGQNFPSDADASPYQLREGSAPQADGELVLDAGTAAAAGYAVGDTVPVFTTAEPQPFTLVGVAGFGEADNLAGAGVLLFSEQEALALSGTPDEVGQIDVVGTGETDPVELRDRVAQVLPAGVEAVTGAQQAENDAAGVAEGLGFFTTFLLAFASVALLVGSFLIFNTFTMLVAQRVRELALLRAVGAGRRQVVTSVLVESAVLGLVAGAVGVGAGIGLAVGLRALLGAFGGDLPEGPLVVAPRTVVVSLVVGVVVTTVAALVPALRASRIPPVAALRDAALPSSSGRLGTVLGLVLLVAGAVSLGLGLQGNLTLAGLGALGVFLGVAALAPLLTPLLRPLGRLFRSTPRRIGARNAERNPRRTASTASALMIGVALVCAVSVVGSSLTASFTSVVEESFSADLAVTERGFASQGLDPVIARDVAALPAVDRVDDLPFGPARLGGPATDGEATQEATLTSVPEGALGASLTVAGVDGEVDELQSGQVLLDAEVATELGLSVGDTVPVAADVDDASAREVRLVGTYEPNVLAEQGLLAQADASEVLLDPDSLLLVVGTGSLEETRAAVETVTDRYPTAELQSRDDVIGEISSGIDQLLLFVNILLLLSVVVAFFGIVNTMALSVVERTRELGVLRAVGLSRRQMRRMISVEALLVGVFGGLLGVALGTTLGIALQRVLAEEGFEVLRIPWLTLVAAVVVSALAGLLAAVLPAFRAGRMDVLEAIRSE